MELNQYNIELDKNTYFVIQCGSFEIKEGDIIKKLGISHISKKKHGSSDAEFLGDVEIVYRIIQ